MFGKRIVSLLLCLVITFSLSGVAFAEDYINRPVTFFDYIQRAWVNGTNNLPFGSVLNALGGLTFGQVCGSSPDAYHHTDSIKGATLGEDEHGQYANAICKYCGQAFKVYSSDLSAAYNDYVDDVKTDLGTSVLTSNGLILYATPTLEGGYPATLVNYKVTSGFYMYYEPLVAPVNGYYTAFIQTGSTNVIQIEPVHQFVSVNSSGSRIDIPFYTRSSVNAGTALIGDTFRCLFFGCKDYKIFTSYSIKMGWVVEPVQSISNYINSRPTVIIGPIGYYDASNNLQVLNNTTVFNETNNTFFNPITNTTTNVTNWAYDYSDRSYNLTLSTGDTVSVTYGDENITINEGGTTYNVYYVYSTDNSGGGDDTDVSGFLAWWKEEWEDFRSWLATALRFGSGSDCEHTYTSAVDRESACTEPGLRTYTCTKCGHAYTELIDALGHDWTVTGHVDEVLDEVGNVVEKGYDKLTCSRCDAESKDYGEGPVESDIFDALGDLIADGITWILGKLTELADSLHGITDVFTSFVEKVQAMPGEYPLFFAAFVAIIPEDLSTVLWFSVIVFVVVAVWKKWSA